MAQPTTPPLSPEEERRAIERVRRVTTQRIDYGPALPIGQALCCPRCGDLRLQCLGVVVFDRDYLGANRQGLPVGSTAFIRVYDGAISQHSLPLQSQGY